MTAKVASTLDTISGGRLILGLGCGFKVSEARAFGMPFPDMKERLAMLGEHFEIISRMTRRDEPPFTFTGEHARVENVINTPRTGGGDHIRAAIGGHGQNVTFRLAAKYCDEINIDLSARRAWRSDRRSSHERCDEIGRDPATLGVVAGTNPAWPYPGLKVDRPAAAHAPGGRPGDHAVRLRCAPAALGGDRAVGRARDRRRDLGVPGLVDTDEGVYELIDDLRTAGIELAPAAASA